MKHDANLFDTDMICFTETQLLPSSNDTEIRNFLHPFTLLRQDHATDKYSSLALCSKAPLEIREYHYIPEINATFAVETCRSMTQINILLL